MENWFSLSTRISKSWCGKERAHCMNNGRAVFVIDCTQIKALSNFLASDVVRKSLLTIIIYSNSLLMDETWSEFPFLLSGGHEWWWNTFDRPRPQSLLNKQSGILSKRIIICPRYLLTLLNFRIPRNPISEFGERGKGKGETKAKRWKYIHARCNISIYSTVFDEFDTIRLFALLPGRQRNERVYVFQITQE